MGTSITSDISVKVAVDTGTEVGNRAVRVLLGERSVDYIGVLAGGVPDRKRSGPVNDLDGYDVLMSDGTSDIHGLIGKAAVAGIPLVYWLDLDDHLDSPGHIPVIHGANVAAALTAALAVHPVATSHQGDEVRIGWTEPGKSLKRGQPMPFPDPIGNTWTKRRGKRRSGADEFVGFRNDEWGGAVVDVEGPAGRRIVGVADHAGYIEAITLAAVSLLAGEGAYDSRSQAAASNPEQLLNKLGDLELEVAVWRSSQ
ncbi:MAG: hypothetical protein M5U23_13255 [Acidimicrobiia bacterium]|nr:hypothetical protein [Acidimicrobiia bacterium]